MNGYARRVLGTSALIVTCVIGGCSRPADTGYQGYLEADYAYVGAPLAGRLTALSVQRGMPVQAGAALYALDATLETQQLAEAQSRLEQARALRADLNLGRRPEEIRVISERVREARSALALAQAELKRTTELSHRGLASADALDRAVASEAQARARVASVLAEQNSAGLAGRPEALAAADAAIAAADAVVAQARWRLAQMQVAAGTDGSIVDTLYQLGEWVPAGSPVIKLLPATGPFVRFFVPLRELSQWQRGQALTIACEGCPAGLTATVSYIAAAPEYTPPIIYSESRSDDLVYRVEARFDKASPLAPGLPVHVERAGLATSSP